MPKRTARTPIDLTAYERALIDEARGDTPFGKYVREAALSFAAYELGQRSVLKRERHPLAYMQALRARYRHPRP